MSIPRYQVLGQSNYALAVILDSLFKMHGRNFSVSVYSNIPAEENDSLAHPFLIPGIEVREYTHDHFSRDPGAQLLIGSLGRGRSKIFEFFRDQYGVKQEAYSNLIHPAAILPQTFSLGKGINISPGVTIAPFAQLGDLVVVNRNVSIGHHTHIGMLSTLNPGVTLAGVCRIGERVSIGAGATIIDSVEIGDNTVVGAGSLVTKSLPANVVAYGVPAKVVRQVASK